MIARARSALRLGPGSAGIVAFAGILCLGTPAYAYRTAGDLEDFEGTERVGWPSGVTSFVLVDGIPGAIGGTESNAELARRALGAWEDVSCTSVIASLKGTTFSPAAYGDGINSIQWVDSGWEELGFRPGASGASDLRYEERDGQWVIVEADVYLNLYAHSWITGVADEDAEDGVAEIVGVMTHEFGHALGLLHPCEEGGEPECTEKMMAEPGTRRRGTLGARSPGEARQGMKLSSLKGEPSKTHRTDTRYPAWSPPSSCERRGKR